MPLHIHYSPKYFFYGAFGCFKSCYIIQVLILIVLWLNRNKLVDAVQNLISVSKSDEMTNKWTIKIGMAFLLFLRFSELVSITSQSRFDEEYVLY